MSNTETNTLIKIVAIDVITITTYWGLVNNYKTPNNHIKYLPIYSTILGVGLMVLSVKKYM
jgi:hypothetical protein